MLWIIDNAVLDDHLVFRCSKSEYIKRTRVSLDSLMNGNINSNASGCTPARKNIVVTFPQGNLGLGHSVERELDFEDKMDCRSESTLEVSSDSES